MAGLNLNKKLWRIPQQGMVRGVCAGLAHYLDVPVKLVRVVTVLSIFFGLWMTSCRQVSNACARWSGMSPRIPSRCEAVFVSFNGEISYESTLATGRTSR